jgi:glycine/D-amino acid oxidase-like deaminating enzyme
MKTAVLGAGLSGVCAALELAEAGCDVDLVDFCPHPLMRASRASEGKIHLGYVYAKDDSLRTARVMLEGASVFKPLIERWVGKKFWDMAVSAPFRYAVPGDSLLSVEQIRGHFSEVSRLSGACGPDLLARGTEWRELDPGEWRDVYDPKRIRTVLETGEVAVDVPQLCGRLQEAVRNSPRIRFTPECWVNSVETCRGGFQVRTRQHERDRIFRADSVINALWEGRLPVDAGRGFDVSRPMIHRYKVGLRTRSPEVRKQLPNVTFLVGAYGDAVVGRDTAYVSWYPAGLLSEEVGLSPETFDPVQTPERARNLVRDSLAGLRRLMPGLESILQSEDIEWELNGGYISAWGTTGILDPASELHERFSIGVHSRGQYHSIDTGKLTTAPLFAAEACRRVLGE